MRIQVPTDDQLKAQKDAIIDSSYPLLRRDLLSLADTSSEEKHRNTLDEAELALLGSSRVVHLTTLDLYLIDTQFLSAVREVSQRSSSAAVDTAAVSYLLQLARALEQKDDTRASAVQLACTRIAYAVFPAATYRTAGPSQLMRDKSETTAGLVKFASTQGAQFHRTEPACIRSPEISRCERVAAASVVEPGTLLAEVPVQSMISVEYSIKHDATVGEDLYAIRSIGDDVVAQLYLMWALKHPGLSTHDALVQWLPRFVPSPCCHLSKQALRCTLHGTPIVDTAVEYRDQLEKRHAALFGNNLLSNQMPYAFAQNIPLSEYLWAVSVWDAYALKLAHPNSQPSSDCFTAIAPRVCSMNHDGHNGAHIARFMHEVDPVDETLRLYTAKPANPGEEITLSYGRLSNAELLLHFGFTVGPNDEDTVEIQFCDADISSAKHEQLLSSNGLGKVHVVSHRNVLPSRLVASARVLSISSEATADFADCSEMLCDTKQRMSVDDAAVSLLQQKLHNARASLCLADADTASHADQLETEAARLARNGCSRLRSILCGIVDQSLEQVARLKQPS